MVDYSNNEYEKKLLILNYTKTEENIIVNLANGENYSIPNVIHNEKVVLEKMRAQVINAYDKENELRNDLLKEFVYLMIESTLIYANYIGLEYTYNPKLNMIVVSTLLVLGIITFKNIVKDYKILMDIEKNKLFLQYEKLINEYVTGDDLNLNDIDDMSPYKLSKIIICANNKQKSVN